MARRLVRSKRGRFLLTWGSQIVRKMEKMCNKRRSTFYHSSEFNVSFRKKPHSILVHLVNYVKATSRGERLEVCLRESGDIFKSTSGRSEWNRPQLVRVSVFSYTRSPLPARPLTWEPATACRSSCSVWTSFLPIAGRPRLDRWAWIPHWCLPTLCTPRSPNRRATPGGTATVGSGRNPGRPIGSTPRSGAGKDLKAQGRRLEPQEQFRPRAGRRERTAGSSKEMKVGRDISTGADVRGRPPKKSHGN